jgi:hypothetical protein
MDKNLTVTLAGRTIFSADVESVDTVTTADGLFELKASFTGVELDALTGTPI